MPQKFLNGFYTIISNPIFLSAFFSWFIAQAIKAIIEVFKSKSPVSQNLFVTLFWVTGGMPSSHSSMVSSVATAIGFVEGVDSSLFILSLFYAALMIRDALGVRRAAGVQAATMNKLGQDLTEKLEIEYNPVKEVKGHKAVEVTVGMLLGFFIAVAFCRL